MPKNHRHRFCPKPWDEKIALVFFQTAAVFFLNGGSIFSNGVSIFLYGVSIFLYGVGVFPNVGSICQYHLCSYQSSAKKSAVAIGNDLEIRLFSAKVALVARFSHVYYARA